jgi:hypothetical protein
MKHAVQNARKIGQTDETGTSNRQKAYAAAAVLPW